jgi:hypothetical protein
MKMNTKIDLLQIMMKEKRKMIQEDVGIREYTKSMDKK